MLSSAAEIFMAIIVTFLLNPDKTTSHDNICAPNQHLSSCKCLLKSFFSTYLPLRGQRSPSGASRVNAHVWLFNYERSRKVIIAHHRTQPQPTKKWIIIRLFRSIIFLSSNWEFYSHLTCQNPSATWRQLIASCSWRLWNDEKKIRSYIVRWICQLPYQTFLQLRCL